jgi:hypothetical protein
MVSIVAQGPCTPFIVTEQSFVVKYSPVKQLPKRKNIGAEQFQPSN